MSANPESVRRLVLIRPSRPATPTVRRMLLARRGDALLPAPRRTPPSQRVRAL